MKDHRRVTRYPPEVTEQVEWVELYNYNKGSERLDPGGEAQARILHWDITRDEWFATEREKDGGAIVIHDPWRRNFVLPLERVPVRVNPVTSRWEVEGTFGLLRKGVAVDNIDFDGSGDVRIWTKGVQAFPRQDITAHLNWMHNDQRVSSGKEVLVQFFRDEGEDLAEREGNSWYAGRWVIVAAECE